MIPASRIIEAAILSLVAAELSMIGAHIRDVPPSHMRRQEGERGVAYVARLLLFFLGYWIISLPDILRAAGRYAVKPARWLLLPKPTPDSPCTNKGEDSG